MNALVKIHTDGACRGNPGPGGWGVVLCANGHLKKLYGNEPYTTNNRMELMAAIKGLAALKKSCVVELYTDSQYVRRGMTEWMPKWVARNWRTRNKRPVKNADLWQKLAKETERHQIKWYWVRGHSGNPDNELADQLANQGIDELLRK